MKNFKKSAFAVLVCMSSIGAYSVYAMTTHDEIKELEADLFDLQVDVNILKEEQIELNNLAEMKKEQRLYKQSIFNHKRCILANIKVSKDMEVTQETKDICFIPASKTGGRLQAKDLLRTERPIENNL